MAKMDEFMQPNTNSISSPGGGRRPRSERSFKMMIHQASTSPPMLSKPKVLNIDSLYEDLLSIQKLNTNLTNSPSKSSTPSNKPASLSSFGLGIRSSSAEGLRSLLLSSSRKQQDNGGSDERSSNSTKNASFDKNNARRRSRSPSSLLKRSNSDRRLGSKRGQQDRPLRNNSGGGMSTRSNETFNNLLTSATSSAVSLPSKLLGRSNSADGLKSLRRQDRSSASSTRDSSNDDGTKNDSFGKLSLESKSLPSKLLGRSNSADGLKSLRRQDRSARNSATPRNNESFNRTKLLRSSKRGSRSKLLGGSSYDADGTNNGTRKNETFENMKSQVFEDTVNSLLETRKKERRIYENLEKQKQEKSHPQTHTTTGRGGDNDEISMLINNALLNTSFGSLPVRSDSAESLNSLALSNKLREKATSRRILRNRTNKIDDDDDEEEATLNSSDSSISLTNSKRRSSSEENLMSLALRSTRRQQRRSRNEGSGDNGGTMNASFDLSKMVFDETMKSMEPEGVRLDNAIQLTNDSIPRAPRSDGSSARPTRSRSAESLLSSRLQDSGRRSRNEDSKNESFSSLQGPSSGGRPKRSSSVERLRALVSLPNRRSDRGGGRWSGSFSNMNESFNLSGSSLHYTPPPSNLKSCIKTAPSLEPKKVEFGSISIRRHPLVIGDNPSVTSGAPLQIGWKVMSEATHSIDLYEHLQEQKGRRSRRELRFPVDVRSQILIDSGHSVEEICDATFMVLTIQRQRKESSRDAKCDRQTGGWRRLLEGIFDH